MKKIFKWFFITTALLILLFISFFFLVKRLDAAVIEESDIAPVVNDKHPLLLPSHFMDGGRFYLKMPSVAGDTLMAFGDSGGGISFIRASTVNKLGKQNEVSTALFKGVMPFRYIPFSDVVKDHKIPQPLVPRYMVLRRLISRLTHPYLVVFKEEGEIKFMLDHQPLDIFLGQNFFMHKSWTFDYIHQQVWVNTPLSPREAGRPGVQPIGFRKNSTGTKIYGHPSCKIEVDGEILDMLFDTGASIVLTEEGKKILNTTQATLSGSFIAASVFDRWRKRHPEWKCIKNAELSGDIIEVPKVKIGSYEAGPVMFVRKPDQAWSEGMVQSMDRVVKGAVGGSLLRYFKVTIDYNSALLKIERPL